MPTVTTLKALIKQFNVALELDETQRAMSKAERTRYILKLDQARTKLDKLEGLGQAVHSTHQGSNKRAVSRARVKVVTTYNYGRRKSGFKATCMTGNGISYAWGEHERSVKRALAMLTEHCSCNARFHMRG